VNRWGSNVNWLSLTFTEHTSSSQSPRPQFVASHQCNLQQIHPSTFSPFIHEYGNKWGGPTPGC
jgi:hypothetical protein